jgi:hypothetical protein
MNTKKLMGTKPHAAESAVAALRAGVHISPQLPAERADRARVAQKVEALLRDPIVARAVMADIAAKTGIVDKAKAKRFVARFLKMPADIIVGVARFNNPGDVHDRAMIVLGNAIVNRALSPDYVAGLKLIGAVKASRP